jgi:thiamine-phosphate pyrophosphorylase
VAGGARGASARPSRSSRRNFIVGGGNATDRHKALEIGEVQPDYIFFGKIGGDIKPEAHPKNVALAEWWASMVEIPCIVLGRLRIRSRRWSCGRVRVRSSWRSTGRFSPTPAQAPHVVAAVNALLDEKAPRFEQ